VSGRAEATGRTSVRGAGERARRVKHRCQAPLLHPTPPRSPERVMLRASACADEPCRMRLPLRRLIAFGAAAAVVGAGGQAIGASSPPPGMPPTGHIRLGVGAKKPGAFDSLTHHHHDVSLLFDMLGGSWVKWQGIKTQIDHATSSHRIAMITLGVTRVSDRHKFSPGELAAGKADVVYISYSKQANATG